MYVCILLATQVCIRLSLMRVYVRNRTGQVVEFKADGVEHLESQVRERFDHETKMKFSLVCGISTLGNPLASLNELGIGDGVVLNIIKQTLKPILTVSFKATKTCNASTRECNVTLVGHDGDVNSAIFWADASFVFTASIDRTAKTWNAYIYYSWKTSTKLHGIRPQRVGHLGTADRALAKKSSDLTCVKKFENKMKKRILGGG